MSIFAAAAVPHPPIIIPEIGRGEERKIAKTAEAINEVMRRLADIKPDTVIITSPHSVMYSDYFHISPGSSAKGDMGSFRASGLIISADYDKEFVAELMKLSQTEKIPAGTLGERDKSLDHGTLIPLYYLNKLYKEYRLVRIGLSGLSPVLHYRFGRCIAKTAENLGRRAVLIASGDLSHKLKTDGPYGYTPEGPLFDKELTEVFSSGDFLELLRFQPEFSGAAAECGLRSFQIMAGALNEKAVTHELLSYEGPFGVGYGVAYFEVKGEDKSRNFGRQYEIEERARIEKKKENEDEYVRLARLSIEKYLSIGAPPPLPENLPAEMTGRRAGTFVSLKKHGQLRGCIGTVSATKKCIAEEILQNAVSAATEDPRFNPVTENELDELEISVDVLGETEEIESEALLDVKRYGVIVESGRRRGLLLPNLEGVNTVEEQIAISKQKAGIRPGEKVKLFRFEVVRHK